MNNGQIKVLVAYLALIFWLVGTAWAFYWFQTRDVRSFQPDLTGQLDKAVFSFTSESLSQLMSRPDYARLGMMLDGSKALVLHFWRPGCSCNRFNLPHVKSLVKTYQSQGIRFIVVTPGDTQTDADNLREQIKRKFGIHHLLVDQENRFTMVPAAPAAVVITGTSQQPAVRYFGAYSFSALCGPDDGSYVETALDSILQSKPGPVGGVDGRGCFCGWNPVTSGKAVVD